MRHLKGATIDLAQAFCAASEQMHAFGQTGEQNERDHDDVPGSSCIPGAARHTQSGLPYGLIPVGQW
ncbi:hypothetical protein GCM10022419_031820 [Nonomuraea rosea]|uniref:Uncharacterized protein n=1 Tax=Nonomuraea rosea TaxID=638574 RepID=A0ABP6WDJ5_9ACTN